MAKRLILTLFTTLGALLGAALSFVLDTFVFEPFEVPNALAMGIYFALPALLAAAGALVALLCAPIAPVTRDKVFKKCVAVMLIVAVVGSFVIAAGMQLLYGLNVQGGKTAVILLDVSGSMDTNQCREASVSAAKEMVNNMNETDRCALIFFADTATVAQELGYADKTAKKNMIDALDNVELGITTNLNSALESTIDQLGTQTRGSGIFVITDAEVSYVEASNAEWVEKNSSFYVLDISGADDGNVLRTICNASGGAYVQSDDPNEIESLYMGMFEGFYDSNLHLNRVRSGGGMPQWYYMLISALFHILLGVLMTIAYTALYNNKKIWFVWNIFAGVVAAAVSEAGNWIFFNPIIPTIMMLVAFVIVYPTVYIGSSAVSQEIPSERAYASEYMLR